MIENPKPATPGTERLAETLAKRALRKPVEQAKPQPPKVPK